MNSTVTPTGVIEADAVIIGAGPVGLFQVFELGLLEIKAHVIDSLNAVGGQCVELYPDKPIYDIPAVPSCTGQELTDNLLKQIEPFEPTFHLGQEVTKVERRDDGRFDVETTPAQVHHQDHLHRRRRWLVPGPYPEGGRHRSVRRQPAALPRQGSGQFEGKNLVICGGGDSALDWALNFVGKAESVVLLHRREEFRAAPASVAKMKACATTTKCSC
jgi:thioredoxin reductase (NADPH)